MLKKLFIFLPIAMLVACTPTHMVKQGHSKNPSHWIAKCEPTQQAKFKKGFLGLNTVSAGSRIYLLHNISKKTIVFNHETGSAMNAGWSSTLSPKRWSALLIHQKNFNVSCTQISSSGVSYLDCSKLIKVCHVTNLDMHEKQEAYWMSENRTRAAVNVHLYNDAR